ncbi:hypothetical protein [Holzapfeliella sp. JNUCC 80]
MRTYMIINKLLIANAAIGILFCIPTPFFANIFNPLGLLDVVTVFISVFILVKAFKDPYIKKTSSILMILATVVNCIAIFHDIHDSLQVHTGDLDSLIIGMELLFLQCISMALRLFGIVAVFFEYRRLSKLP